PCVLVLLGFRRPCTNELTDGTTNDALDRRLEPEVPIPHRGCGSGVDVLRCAAAAQHARRRISGVRAAAGRGADALPRPDGTRGRAARQHAARAIVERHQGTTGDPVEVGAAALVDRASLQARYERAPRAPAGAGAGDGGDAVATDMGRAAGDH